MNNTDNNGDIEMFSLRRSARIAEKERQKFIQSLNLLDSVINRETPKIDSVQHITSKQTKSKDKELAKVSGDKVSGKIRKKSQKPKKTNNKNNKFVNLETTKINDVFPLIRKYSQNEVEKNEKYHLLQTIVKYRKEMKIKNLVTDLYLYKATIEINVYKYLQHNGYTLISITNHLNDILSYKEIDDLDSVTVDKNENHNTYIEQDCDNLVSSLSMMSIQSKEHQMQRDLDEIEKLNSMICRLMM